MGARTYRRGSFANHAYHRYNRQIPGLHYAIPSLKYYLIVEPETVYVTMFSKNDEGKWEAMTYVRKTDVVPMPLLDISLPLEEVYK
jgi:Uma2 family endonuclease